MRRNRPEDTHYYLKKAKSHSVDTKNRPLTPQTLKEVLLQSAGILKHFFEDRAP